jgi:hypothetical protein
MTTIERAAQQERVRELRERARNVRESALRSDSRLAYDEDMRLAARYENEADELDAELHDEFGS